ncbi:hypothetical protein CYMTET_4751 [Cymbomonas tetramitiformis]|uniref:Uncharacterized protein n=1 Tax=Cymbomonas tetramitiformis TaxID=36881 RepID=A0AAE0H0S1_9CHLO|nr:hypothetical protein CYMTET_4751 [Cymbomonas tetramitiformis]
MAHGIARYFLAPDLYPAKLWQLYCKEHSVNFAAQAESLGWWRTLDSKSKKPANVLEFEEAGGVLIKPDVSYDWYLRRIKTFDLRFGQVKVDTCDTCDSFKHQCAKAPSGSEEEKRVHSEWNAHRQRADKSYDSRCLDANVTLRYYAVPLANDEKPAHNSLKKTETQTQDFGGNLRTPRVTVGEAYYLRHLPTFCYSMYSHARQCTVLYFWNEKIAEKGANNCISVEHYQHEHYPSGAMHLVKWYDGTASQCNNGTMLRYNLEITDPDSKMFMYERMDVKVPPTGHTYLINDTWFGAPEVPPPICVEPPQDIHRDWTAYLAQLYVKTTRPDQNGKKVNISEFHWFNFGIAEVLGPDGKILLKGDGTPELATHPGEVWMRRELDDKEPWTIVDLRKRAPRNRAEWGKGVRTQDLPPLPNVLPITNPTFQLYSGPLPITKEKVQDLHKLSKFLPDPAKAALYPPYVEGMRCKGDVAEASAAEEEPQEDDSEIDLSEDQISSSGDDSSSSEEEPLANRLKRIPE